MTVLSRLFYAPLPQSGPGRPGPARAVVHLHVPKSGGTTLNAILLKNFPPERTLAVTHGTLGRLTGLPRVDRARLQLVHGHLPYGIGRWLPQGALYLALLRRPTNRLYSFYRYIARTPEHPLHDQVAAPGVDFGAFLDMSETTPTLRVELDNGQVRRLSGQMGPARFGDEAMLLRVALANMFAPDMICGTMERLDVFLESLVRRGVIAHGELKKLNVAPESSDLDAVLKTLSKDQSARLATLTRWDDCLYSICETYSLTQAEGN